MTQKILLADDSVTIRKVVELTFSDEDFTIISVGDGALALERARSERPEIILSDVIMPGLNGYELCQQVKSDAALKGIPFLFLKGTFESFDEEKARQCGADGFIVKPFESQEMIRRVKDLIAAGPSRVPAVAPAAPLSRPSPAPVVETPPARTVAGPVPVAVFPAAPSATAAAGPRPPVTPAPPAARPVPPPPPPRPMTPPTPASPPAWGPARAPAPPPAPVKPAAVPHIAPTMPAVSLRVPGGPAPMPPSPPAGPLAVSPPTLSPPPPPSAPRPKEEEFGFDFGMEEEQIPSPVVAARPVTIPPPIAPPVPSLSTSFADIGAEAGFTPARSPLEPETEEDQWSEVSLRDRVAPVLEDKALEEESFWGTTGSEESIPGKAATETPEEDYFEEVTTARREPEPVPPPPFVPPPPPPPEPEPGAEPAAHALPAPHLAPAVPEAAAPFERTQVERLISEKMETMLREIMGPIVGDISRKIIEEVAWDVIPDLAEVMIRQEIERIRQNTRSD